MILGKYSFGIGDRFGRQGKALLSALIKARKQGVNITPVWNKSYREHSIIRTRPADVRKEADEAVSACGWDGPYFVDADHIGLKNVDEFIEASSFFTIDVADFIGKPAEKSEVRDFIRRHNRFIGSRFDRPELTAEGLSIGDIGERFEVTEEKVKSIARKYLVAIKEAGRVYRQIESAKGVGNFITEVSMDEADEPQTPVELLFILAAIADEGIAVRTIAPKFAGRFNKGVDYVGDVGEFARQFEQDIAVIRFAVKEFGLSSDLKLSVHSGSDKFSIYGAINRAIKKFDAGLHIKTAGTTWLEELTGLAMAGGDGLAITKEIYAKAAERIDELSAPYATVIDIDSAKLPEPKEVDRWDGARFASALRHNQACELYNPNFRQLLHVSYKIAAEMGARYLDAVEKYEDIIARNVTENLYERHIRPIFVECGL